MPDDPGMYWDDSEYDDDETFVDDHAAQPSDEDDIFEVRTFDTSLFNGGLPEADDDDDSNGSDESTNDFAHSTPRMPPRPASKPVTRAPIPTAAIPLQRATASVPAPTPATAAVPAPVTAAPARPRARSAPRRAAPPPPVHSAWVTVRTILIVVIAAMLVSTLFSLWTRPDFFSDEFRAGLNQVQATQRVINIQPTPLPTESRTVKIGIIAGHSGKPQDENFESDPGAVCPDGLTELSINEAVAREVVTTLSSMEYEVELLEEFDERLAGYQADVLISIHSNDCQDYGAAGTGFGAAAASARQTTRGEDDYLLECLVSEYGATTGLPHHTGQTYDMTEYHTFDEVSADTPTAIIELGFMYNDRLMLTTQQSLLAQGVVNGILCFLQPDDTGG